MEPQYLSVRVIRAKAPDALNAHLLNVRHGVSENEEESAINLAYPPYLTLLNVKIVKADSTRQVVNRDLIFGPHLKKVCFLSSRWSKLWLVFLCFFGSGGGGWW